MNQMSGMGGLLSSMPQQQAGQGLLAGPPQGKGGIALAMKLSQSPTPETAQAILSQLRAENNPEADKFTAMIEQTGGDPKALKQLADAIVAKLSAQ